MGEAKKRKVHSAEFKTKVGLEALRGVKTINEIGQEYGVHPVQVGSGRRKSRSKPERCLKASAARNRWPRNASQRIRPTLEGRTEKQKNPHGPDSLAHYSVSRRYAMDGNWRRKMCT
jgi:transposase-like protein